MVPATSGLQRYEQLIGATEAAIADLLELSSVHFDDINVQPSGVFVVGWNKWQWDALSNEAAPRVGKARIALNDLKEFSDQAARQAPDRRRDMETIEVQLGRMIEQPNGSHPKGAPKQTIEQIRELASKLADDYRSVVSRLPTAFGDAERLLVVDTSAALDRPDLTAWKLDGEPWTVVLLPVLHSELDDRKREARTRDAARKVINQIEEFDRRGDTFSGVPLSGRLSVREIPISADMGATLPWLRAEVQDDAFIAGALELMWMDLTAPIAITASDRNLRNKARLAGLGVIHPDRL